MMKDAKPFEIVPGVCWVGALDPDLPAFDLVMPLDSGTTYNSYLILDEKIALIDAVKSGFEDQLFEHIEHYTDPGKIDYIVINHFEQDHTGCLEKLLEAAPGAELVISRNATPFMKATLAGEVAHRTVDDDTELPLGKRMLRFYRAPFLHWPDTMFDYLLPEKILFPCDAFGFHYCELDETKAERIDWNLKYYYDLIMRPFREYVTEAVEKISDLDIDIICPSHGPIRRKDPESIIRSYRDWSAGPGKFDRPTIVLLFASFYRNTAKIAREIERGIEEAGVAVHSLDISLGVDESVKELVEDAAGLLVGTPTMAGSPLFHIWDLFKYLSVISRRGKPAGVFGSFGWNGAGVKITNEVLRSLTFKIPLDPFTVKLVPTKEDLESAFEFGRSFAAQLK